MLHALPRAPIVTVLALLCFEVLGPGASAQTLPQSTLDRQQIVQLQNELSNPSITPSQRRDIQMQIATLEYRISTRPLIVPPPNLAPVASPAPFPYVAKPATVGTPPDGRAPVPNACSERAALAARLRATERDAPFAAQRAYAHEALARLAALPC